MPTRVIRDGILTSERVDALTWPEEVFYRRLQSVVDDHGRYYAHHSLLLAACYPLKLKKVSDSDIGKWLTACVNAALVRVYPASDGKRYLEILNFRQRIQSKSKFPAPSGDPPELTVIHGGPPERTENNGLGGVVVGVVVEGEKPARKVSKSGETPIPEDFGISDRVERWAAEKGYGDLQAHLEAFIGKAKAKRYTYASWDDAFMNSVREDWARLRTVKPGETPVRKRRQL